MSAKRIEQIWRLVRPWLDPGSRRPLILLAVVTFGIVLAPLALDVGNAVIAETPRGVRHGLGHLSIISMLGLGGWRLWTVRPKDSWPEPWAVGEAAEMLPADRLLPWALRLAVASLAFPIVEHPDGLGFADWDFVLDKFEAARRSVLVWGQFPWWDPWCRGGFPLAAEPQIGTISVATPFVLGFGSGIGLRIAAVLCLGIAVEGAYRLSRLWLRDPWAASTSALIYGLNGGVLLNTAWGYVIPMSYCGLPWLVLQAFRVGSRPADGLWLGFWAAFLVMNGMQYLTLYASLVAAAAWVRALRVQPAGRRSELLLHTVMAFGAFLVLCGWRFVTTLLVVLDDQRGRASSWDESPFSLLHALLTRPRPDWPTAVPVQHMAAFIETTCYIGPVVFLLAVGSLVWGWRWWHTLVVVCTWLALGSVQWYQPSSWLGDWPVFASTHAVTRWRFVTMLGLGLAAGSVVARWRNSRFRLVRALAVAASVAIAVDLVSLAHQNLSLAAGPWPGPSTFPGPPVADIVNVRRGIGYPCTMRGYGIITGYEPMLSGYRRDAPSLRRAREDPGYQGEAWTQSGPVQPVSWSPNRIEFEVAPGELVEINQNPGSWWWVNGRQAFPGTRCAEAMRPFLATSDERGRVVLEIWPRGLTAGLILHPLGIAILASSWIAARRRARHALELPTQR